MGAGGVYYQASLGAGRRPHELGPVPTGSRASVPASSDVVFEDHRGASVQALVPTSSDDLVQQLNEAARRRPLTWWVVFAFFVLGLATMPFGLFLWLLGIPVVWWVVLHDRAKRSVVIFYDVNDEHARQFQALVEAGQSLAQSQKLWRINASGALHSGHQQKVNAGAGALVRRSLASVTHGGPTELVTNIAVPGVSAEGASMYFLPDRILLAHKRVFTDISYNSLKVQERQTEFIEAPGAKPSDAVQVGSTWQYVNRNGGPDRRFKNNPVLPVMKYTELELANGNGFRWVLQISNAQTATYFAQELRLGVAFKRAVAGTAVPTAPLRSSEPELPRAPRAVPPPPRAQAPLVASPHAASTADYHRGEARWYTSDEPVDVGHGVRIPGMIYIGHELASPRGGVEPSLIVPSLPIDSRHPDWSGKGLSYWPSYSTITPASRAAYLSWLGQGRRLPDVPIGYVFLFMYGLERRVFIDLAKQSKQTSELHQIRAEMTALLETYGDSSGSFSSYGSQFIEAVDFLLHQGADDALEPPALTESRWPVPLALRVQLGTFAAQGKAIPAEWALAWGWFHPEIPLRTPATRCTDKFTQLFRIRYDQRFRTGVTVRPGATKVQLQYMPASSHISPITLTMNEVPDVITQSVPLKKLAALYDDVTTELDAYSRWLGRNPEKAGSLAAIALLPADLLVDAEGVVGDFRRWVQDKLGNAGTAEVSALELFEYWPVSGADKLTKPEAVSLTSLLDSFDAGLEPDVRFGGAAITANTPIVLFRTQPGSPHSATQSYSAALTMMHLATAVIAADGDVTAAELNHLTANIESSLHLTQPERIRLRAHLQWLGASEVKLTGLTKRLNTLTAAQKASLGDMLVTVAGSDGHIAPSEVATLQKIYKLLDLDANLVASRLHSALAGQSAATAGPVTVRPALNRDPGYPIPLPPAQAAQAAQSATAPNGYALDASAVQAKMAESAEVSALLGDIFSDDLPYGIETAASEPVTPGGSAAQVTDEPAIQSVGDLDAAHSRLVRALAGQEQMFWTDFENLSASHGLLPKGARDTVNEAALDASEEPLLEGDEILTINSYALQELLA